MVAEVGTRIRSLRTAKGLTQAQLADPLYTKAYISMLESGRTRASMKALEHIAGVLGVTPADLLGGPPAAESDQYLLVEARRLVEAGQAAEALPILEALSKGLTPGDQLVRLRFLAAAHIRLGQAKRAFPVLERATRMAELLDDQAELVRLKSLLAAAYNGTYAYDEGAKLLRECIKSCEDGVINDPAFHFRRLTDLAALLANQRQPKAALPLFERAIELSQQLSERPNLALVYSGMARAYREAGDLELAIRYNQRSLQVYEELGILDKTACALDSAALLYAEYGNRERARECLARATELAQEVHSDRTLASIKVSEAEVMARTDREGAIEHAQQALKFARKVEQADAQVRAMLLIGELRLTANVPGARRSFTEAVQLAEERVPHLLRAIYDRWSHAAEAGGDSDEALRLARRALEATGG